MRKIMIILVVACFTVLNLDAQSHRKPTISKEEFRAKQIAFITERANLNEEEADRFFPIYMELQDKKKAINNRIYEYFKKEKTLKTTDAAYDEMTNEILKARIESCELEMEYYDRFKKILSPKKIFNIQRAEVKFHHELLKSVNKKNKDIKK